MENSTTKFTFCNAGLREIALFNGLGWNEMVLRNYWVMMVNLIPIGLDFLHLLTNLLQINQYGQWTEFLDLSLEDVGESIEIIYTPVREDGIEGSPRSIRSDSIAPGELSFKKWKNINYVF